MSREKKVNVEISARHVHLTREHVEKLFGMGHELKRYKELSQPGQFAAEEKVDLVSENGNIKGVRVLGPERSHSQVELSVTDCYKLGIKAPVRLSGDIDETPGIKLRGPAGEIELEKGVIVAKRHVHLSKQEAENLGLTHNQKISVKIPGERELVFNQVVVRVSSKYREAVHLDVDEGNAGEIERFTEGYLLY